MFLYFVKVVLMQFCPYKGSTFPGQIINWSQKLLQVWTEQTDIVDNSTKTFAVFWSPGCWCVKYGLLSSFNGCDCNTFWSSFKSVTHVNKFISEELTLLWGQLQSMFHKGFEHVQDSVHVFALPTMHKKIIHDGNVVFRMGHFLHDISYVLNPFAG